MTNHPIWWLLSMTCIAWYSTITIFVTVKGASDIRSMLRNLSESPR